MSCRLCVQVLVLDFCIAALSFGAGARSDAQPASDIMLLPDVQHEIARIVTVFSSGNITEEAVQQIAQEFESFQNIAPQELLLQVLAVYGGKDEYRSDLGAEMTKRLLLSHLLQNMSSSNIVVAVAPKYEQSSDLQLRGNLQHALDMAAFKGGRVEPDFTAFLDYIEQNKDQPPRKLVGYMYDLNSQMAVLSIAGIYLDSPSINQLAEQFKNAPRVAVQSLAELHSWWAHLYVAKMIEKDPSLQTSDIMKQLQDDQDPLVREILARLPLLVEAEPASEEPVISAKNIQAFELHIPFGNDKADIGVEVDPKLDEIAQLLKANPQYVARIEGHTDKTRRSIATYSKNLTGRQAQAVLDYLVKSGGIDAARMTAVGIGFDSPKTPNDPESGNPENKRVIVYIKESP